MGAKRRFPELSESGLIWVIVAFVSLIVLNLITLAMGRSQVLAVLNAHPAGALISPFVFDSWGTIGGLGGIVLLFAPVLFGTPVSQRRALSFFFIAASIGIGEFAVVLWDAFYDTTGLFGSGSSAIAITGQGVIFALSIFGLLRLAGQDTRRLGPLSSHWWYSFAIIYSTLILTSLWFVLSLEPIFIPTLLYNWRVHEFGFLFGAAATVGYMCSRWRALGLDGVIRIDEMLMNFHFDDLCVRFPRRLPKYHVLFRGVEDARGAEFHPERGEIWVSGEFKDREYRIDGPEFERALLHAMVHAELFLEGRPWEHGRPESRQPFNEIAPKVGTPPEP
ncbi:MAG: hypothetical protein OK474_02275 [Thaumarchaeota archaeon]|nr:hypothetical protein [Nitrososphaerota archaeon]